ncbi:hypothetical protein C0J52_20275 [Blattella germanica]|nr:hypothetical protein C0J52_20275 [Blattella germanica]
MSSCDIRYSEGIQSLNWTKIMKTITDDPEGFFDSGGWTFLDPESDDENPEEVEEEEEDDAYEPTDIESEESDDDSDYSEYSEESGSEDLEREAAEADKEQNDFQDEYAEGKKGGKKRPGGFGGRKDDKKDRHSSSKHKHSSSNHKDSHKSSKSSKSSSRSSDKHSVTEARLLCKPDNNTRTGNPRVYCKIYLVNYQISSLITRRIFISDHFVIKVKCREVHYGTVCIRPSKSRDKHHDKHKSSSSDKKRSREDSGSRDRHSKKRYSLKYNTLLKESIFFFWYFIAVVSSKEVIYATEVMCIRSNIQDGI